MGNTGNSLRLRRYGTTSSGSIPTMMAHRKAEEEQPGETLGPFRRRHAATWVALRDLPLSGQS